MIFKIFLTKTECLSFSLLAIYPYNLGQWGKKFGRFTASYIFKLSSTWYPS